MTDKETSRDRGDWLRVAGARHSPSHMLSPAVPAVRAATGLDLTSPARAARAAAITQREADCAEAEPRRGLRRSISDGGPLFSPILQASSRGLFCDVSGARDAPAQPGIAGPHGRKPGEGGRPNGFGKDDGSLRGDQDQRDRGVLSDHHHRLSTAHDVEVRAVGATADDDAPP